MRRRLFTVACSLSLLACVATSVLWVRSYSQYDYVSIGTDYVLVSQGGFIVLFDGFFNSSTHQFTMFSISPALIVPYILCVPVMLTAAAICYGLRRERRGSLGVCHHCGYNLTGNTSGVCPECGTPTIALALPACRGGG